MGKDEEKKGEAPKLEAKKKEEPPKPVDPFTQGMAGKIFSRDGDWGGMDVRISIHTAHGSQMQRGVQGKRWNLV